MSFSDISVRFSVHHCCLDGGPPLTDFYEHMVPCAAFLSGAAKLPAAQWCVQSRMLGEKAKASPEYSKTLCECFKSLAGALGAAAKLYALPHLCRMVVDPHHGQC
ncbi:hypothetical protein DCAR_0831221 [Daucus carota subsp. sativus]|uniref:Uncharacterized protein n=1 Tax=Daucus carota subsp. sativus TaxID=79200 RepID=A0A175YMQ4_DAUCS|nr:hypothetical protein DCAR_0831221 [Daucus carota subsp. sativus]